MRKNNKLRELTKNDEPTLGTRILNTWPGVLEVLGQTSVFDYVEFTAEYAPWTLYDLENIARAAELSDLSSMIKIDEVPRRYIAAKALASGIQNFLFANVRTVEDAEEAVQSVRAEPMGKMGIGLFRIGGHVFTKFCASDYRKACSDAVVAIMVEKKSTLENLEEILSVDGIDMVQFGPWDYGLSLGLGCEPTTPWGLNDSKVKEAELETIKTALRMDKHPRVEMQTLDGIESYVELGVRDFSVGIDVLTLYNYWKEKGEELRNLMRKL